MSTEAKFLVHRLQFARVLRSRPFALLWVGQTISVLGDAVFTIVITWQVLILTGSATAMSLLVIAQWTPKVLFLLFGGVIADRVSRRLLMLWADAGRGCALRAARPRRGHRAVVLRLLGPHDDGVGAGRGVTSALLGRAVQHVPARDPDERAAAR